MGKRDITKIEILAAMKLRKKYNKIQVGWVTKTGDPVIASEGWLLQKYGSFPEGSFITTSKLVSVSEIWMSKFVDGQRIIMLGPESNITSQWMAYQWSIGN
jgi:hypothetical protein